MEGELLKSLFGLLVQCSRKDCSQPRLGDGEKHCKSLWRLTGQWPLRQPLTALGMSYGFGVSTGKGFYWCFWSWTLPGGSEVEYLTADRGDTGSISGSGRSLEKEMATLIQYSYLENPMDRGSWQATVHRVPESLKLTLITLRAEGTLEGELGAQPEASSTSQWTFGVISNIPLKNRMQNSSCFSIKRL